MAYELKPIVKLQSDRIVTQALTVIKETVFLHHLAHSWTIPVKLIFLRVINNLRTENL